MLTAIPEISVAGVNPSAPAVETAVASALWLWDTLALELGETALVTDGHRLSRLATVVASWYGATPMFVTRGADGARDGDLVADGSADTAKALAARLVACPAVAVAELSGRSELVDLVLEAVPPSSRLLFAGVAREAVTLDYYSNLHRKGLRLVSGVLDTAPIDDLHLERARRLLARTERYAAASAALADGQR